MSTPRSSAQTASPRPPLGVRLRTDRLLLRPPASSDLPALLQALRRNAAHLRPWASTTSGSQDAASLASVSRSIVVHRKRWKLGRAFVFVISPLDDKMQVIGRVALGNVRRGAFQSAHLGYWIDGSWQGKGLMTEAVRAVTSFAFGPASLHRVQAAAMPQNVASLRVLEKAGYRREGLAVRYLSVAGAWADHLLYATTTEEWPGPAP